MRPRAPIRTLALAAGMLIAACETSVAPNSSILSIVITPQSDTLQIGQSRQLTATVQMANVQTSEPDLSWSSSNTAAVTITGAGMVTAMAAGTALVRAAAGDRSDSAMVVVLAPAPPAPQGDQIQSVRLTPSSSSMQVGGTLQLTAIITDTGGRAVSTPVTWASLNPSSASVSNTGIVTGVAEGSAVITAASGGQTGTATIAVTAPPPAGGTICAPTGSGVCRYVDASTGNDANSGSAASPYRTLQKAASVVNPGDMVVVRDGIYTVPSGTFAVLEMDRGGSASNYVVFHAEHQWGAIIDGQSNTTDAGIRFNASYERVEGFEVRGIAHDGVDMGSGLTGLQAAGLHVHDVGRMCNPPAGWGLSAYTLDDNNVIIEQNLIHDIGRYGPGENGCTPANPYYQNNDHGVYLSSGSNITIRNNIFYNIQHGWAVHRYNTGGAGADQVYIVNNTFAFANPWRDGQIVIGDPLTNSVIANNIFYQPSGAGVLYSAGTVSNVMVSHNITYGGVAWEGSTSGATFTGNMDNTDPRLLNPARLDFHLLVGSPAIQAGLALSYVINDYSGTIRPVGAEDIGAYQH